jgi:SulP family sulfate permease
VERGTAAELLTGALAVALLGLVESISIARTIAQKSGDRLDVDQELVPDRSFQHFVDRHGDPACPQLDVVSIHGSLFFGATQHVERALLGESELPPPRHHLLLRMHTVNHCDFTGLEMLEGVVRAFRQRGGDVFMVGVRPAVRVIMYETGFKDDLGEDHSLGPEQAIDHLFESVIDPAICCYECPHRVFAECQTIPKYPRGAGLPPHRPEPPDPSRRLDVREAVRRVATDVVVDVREPEEYRAGHVPGAHSLPLREVLERATELPRDRPVLLVCRAGRRSQRALVILRDLGLSDVRYLAGGILSWKAADFPIELGTGSGPRPEASF